MRTAEPGPTVVTFADDAESRERFNVLYNGMILNPICRGPRPLERLRLEAAIVAKLEAISESIGALAVPGAPVGPIFRRVQPATRVSFTKAETKLLLEYLPAVPWLSAFTPHVIRIVDTLEGRRAG